MLPTDGLQVLLIKSFQTNIYNNFDIVIFFGSFFLSKLTCLLFGCFGSYIAFKWHCLSFVYLRSAERSGLTCATSIIGTSISEHYELEKRCILTYNHFLHHVFRLPSSIHSFRFTGMATKRHVVMFLGRKLTWDVLQLKLPFPPWCLQTFAVVLINFCHGVDKLLPWPFKIFAVRLTNYCLGVFKCLPWCSQTIAWHFQSFVMVFRNICRSVDNFFVALTKPYFRRFKKKCLPKT